MKNLIIKTVFICLAVVNGLLFVPSVVSLIIGLIFGLDTTPLN